MAGLNKVMLIGRLGKDPEVISFDSGGKKMTVSLAPANVIATRKETGRIKPNGII
jgi:single-stranded DNA-binding protein